MEFEEKQHLGRSCLVENRGSEVRGTTEIPDTEGDMHRGEENSYK